MIIKVREKPYVARLFEKLTLSIQFDWQWLDEAEQFAKMDPGKFYKVEIKEVKDSKTLSQIAYAWRMLRDLSKYEHLSKDEVYRAYVRDFHQYDVIAIRNDAVENFKANWCEKGLGWQVEEIRAGDKYTELNVYYGMSSWDKSSMSDFIELLRHECTERKIPVDRII